MKPDQDERLISMSIGEKTCDRCFIDLHPGLDDSVCDNCSLNPIKKGDATQFVKEATKRESSFSFEELVERNKIMNK